MGIMDDKVDLELLLRQAEENHNAGINRESPEHLYWASTQYDRIKKYMPDDRRVYWNSGSVKIDLARMSSAEFKETLLRQAWWDLCTAIQQDPEAEDTAKIRYLRGIASTMLGDFKDAVQVLQDAADQTSDRRLLHQIKMAQGDAFFQSGGHDHTRLALACYIDANIEMEQPDALYKIGLAYHTIGDKKQADEFLRKARLLNPDFEDYDR